MRTIAPLAALLLCACATHQATAPVPTPTGKTCDTGAAQSFVGQKASAETGAAMLSATGARNLRWIAPGMAVTMDYHEDRLTVSYDDAMTIICASCG